MLALIMLLGAMTGWIGHKLFYAPSVAIGPRGGNIARHALGVIFSLPFATLTYHVFGGRNYARFMAAFVLGHVWVGSGSSAGAWHSHMEEQRK